MYFRKVLPASQSATTVALCACVLFCSSLAASPWVSAGAGWGGAVVVTSTALAQARRDPGRSRLPLTKARPTPEVPPASPEAESESPSPDTAPAEGGFVNRLVRFIRNYASWIVIGLLGVFLGILAWTYAGSRRGGRPATGGLEKLGFDTQGGVAGGEMDDHRRYSSTKIQKSDVSSRLGRSVTTTEVETDREYALVVDEDALKMPPIPEDSEIKEAKPTGDPEKIRVLIQQDRHIDAYAEYARQIATDGKLKFPAEVDSALGDELMKAREFEKARRVLERHVATHRGGDVHPEAYFNLGYIHFMNKTLNKSRRFFRLYVQAEKNPEYVARARRILEKIESSGLKN